MKTFSFWASKHVVKSRLLIVMAYGLLNILGLFWAYILLLQHIKTNDSLAFIATITTLAAVYYYPKTRNFQDYFRRKICDMALILSTLAFIIYGSQQLMQASSSNASAYALFRFPIKVAPKSSEISKIHHNQFTGFFQKLALHSHQTPIALKVFFIILTVLATIGVLYLLLGLSCAIVCSGLEALGYTVFFAGSFGIIFGCFKLIQYIIRGPNFKRHPKHP